MRVELSPWPYPVWWAHRGAGKQAPENTLAACREGAAYGFRGFECDVKLSADEQPFLLHDDTLDRTTSGHGPAAALPWQALSQLDAGSWRGRRWAGEPPASLAAVLAFALHNGLAVNLEIKPNPGEAERTGRRVASDVVAAWRRGGVATALPPLLSSFQVAALAGARETAPDLPRALLLDSLWPGWLETALALGCVAVVVDHRQLDAAGIARAHGSGLRVLAYTVNEPAQVQRLLALAVDGLITDAVDRFAPTLTR